MQTKFVTLTQWNHYAKITTCISFIFTLFCSIINHFCCNTTIMSEILWKNLHMEVFLRATLERWPCPCMHTLHLDQILFISHICCLLFLWVSVLFKEIFPLKYVSIDFLSSWNLQSWSSVAPRNWERQTTLSTSEMPSSAWPHVVNLHGLFGFTSHSLWSLSRSLSTHTHIHTYIKTRPH